MKRQRPQGGRIINNGSISAHVPRPFSVPYTATKHAITGLTKSIALDGRAYDIACGQIDIGNALTDMARKMTRGVPQADGRIAVEPTMDVEEVGAAIVHMASLPLDHQHPHHDHHGDQDAVCGAGVVQPLRLRVDQAWFERPTGAVGRPRAAGASGSSNWPISVSGTGVEVP